MACIKVAIRRSFLQSIFHKARSGGNSIALLIQSLDPRLQRMVGGAHPTGRLSPWDLYRSTDRIGRAIETPTRYLVA